MSDRYQPYRAIASQAGVDAVALVPGANFSRLFNKSFHQNERPLLLLIPVDGEPAAVVPNLELNAFLTIGFEGEVFDWRDQQGYQDAFDQLLTNASVASIGVEGQVMRVFVDQALRRASSGIKIVDMQAPISSLRMRKNSFEIEAIRHAISISERALANTIDHVKIGMTERDIEQILIHELFANGAEDFAFSPIVAASANSALPHAHARNDYNIQAGDALLIDFGARAKGLCADITRTFFIEHCSDEHADLYETVLTANLAGHQVVTAGVTAHVVDDVTTSELERSEHADWIVHKTGHGLGRDIHEDPYIMRGNQQVLEQDMVFTIEPGLYIPGALGVRIEDDVLVTANGSESLTSFSKSLTVLP